MKKSIFFTIVVIIMALVSCEKKEEAKPDPITPVIEAGFGDLKVNLSSTNLKAVDLVNGYDVYHFTTNVYVNTGSIYYVIFTHIKNITYDYSISYKNNSTVSTGKVTIIKDETVNINGL
jgi:hypothetical protein